MRRDGIRGVTQGDTLTVTFLWMCRVIRLGATGLVATYRCGVAPMLSLLSSSLTELHPAYPRGSALASRLIQHNWSVVFLW